MAASDGARVGAEAGAGQADPGGSGAGRAGAGSLARAGAGADPGGRGAGGRPAGRKGGRAGRRGRRAAAALGADAVRVARGAQAGARARHVRRRPARAGGARRRGVDGRVHRLPAPARARRASTASTWGTGSSTGRSPPTRACGCIDRTNIRTAPPDLLPERVDLVVIDVSFISLRLVLPALPPLAQAGRAGRRAGQAAVRGGARRRRQGGDRARRGGAGAGARRGARGRGRARVRGRRRHGVADHGRQGERRIPARACRAAGADADACTHSRAHANPRHRRRPGFIGSHLAERLCARGDEVVGFDNFDPFYPRAIKERNLARAARRGAVRASSRATSATRRRSGARSRGAALDAVVHLAALAGVRPSLAEPARYADVNLVGTQRLSTRARAHGVRRFVFASSSSVYGGRQRAAVQGVRSVPASRSSPYAATKRAGELMLFTAHHLYALDVTLPALLHRLRPAPAAGPGDPQVRAAHRRGQADRALRRRQHRARLHLHRRHHRRRGGGDRRAGA